jgi:hypothetical protein
VICGRPAPVPRPLLSIDKVAGVISNALIVRSMRPYNIKNSFWIQDGDTVLQGPPCVPVDARRKQVTGDIFVHRWKGGSERQIWLCEGEGKWKGLAEDSGLHPDEPGKAVHHPLYQERLLKFPTDGQPSWITISAVKRRHRDSTQIM